MLDIGWQELFFIGVVALLVVGPKDLPHTLGAMARLYRKARGMASEFQNGVSEMVREAEMDEIKRNVEKAGSFDMEKELKSLADPTGTLSDDFDPEEFNRQIKEQVESGPPRKRIEAKANDTSGDQTAVAGPDPDTITGKDVPRQSGEPRD